MEPMLCHAAGRGNSETKRVCAVGKLTGGTGARKNGESQEKRHGRNASRYFPLIDDETKQGCMMRLAGPPPVMGVGHVLAGSGTHFPFLLRCKL